MEDGATEAESMLHPMQENPEEEVDEVKEDSDDKGSGGLIDHILSNLVTKRETDEDKEEKKEVEEIKKDEKGGGILDQIISTLVSPKASTAEKYKEQSFFQFRNGGESEDHDKGKQEDTMRVERDNEETEGGGSIIDNIVSHFPKSLPDDAAPTTDEASILIHSIVHD